MLKIQEYLKQKGNTEESLNKLKNDYGIEYKFHPDLDLVILDYSQIDSPRFNPLVDECRGIVLQTGTWDLISRSFFRFYNVGEGKDPIDWTNQLYVTCKHDGSMIQVFWYKDSWVIKTRFSFGDGEVNQSGFTWRQLVLEHLDLNKLDDNLTYVFELCGPYNKVVRRYSPSLFLLALFDGKEEFHHTHVNLIADEIGIPMTETYEFNSLDEVIAGVDTFSKLDPTFEGVVIRDCKDDRVKSKHPNYLALHRLSNNGCLASYKNLVPLIMSGEREEVLIYFPEFKERILETEQKIDKAWKEIDNTWFCYQTEKSRKKFAEGVTKSTKYGWPLFQAYTTGKDPKEFFTTEYILKCVFGDS